MTLSLVEQVSVDEVCLDITGGERLKGKITIE
jgi:nucleotidyltransferase/DNA polymerase involved in DNA repair